MYITSTEILVRQSKGVLPFPREAPLEVRVLLRLVSRIQYPESE